MYNSFLRLIVNGTVFYCIFFFSYIHKHNELLICIIRPTYHPQILNIDYMSSVFKLNSKTNKAI